MCCCCCGCKKGCQNLLAFLTCSLEDYTSSFEDEYHHVLRFKGERAVYYKPQNHKYSVAQIKYRQDLVAGKQVWHDDFEDDFKQTAKNSLGYVGTCTASRIHPYNRKERLVVVLLSFVMSLSMALGKAAMIKSLKNDHEKEQEDEGEEENFDGTAVGWTISVLNWMLLFLFSSVLKQLATCSCAQGDSVACCRSLCEQMAHCLMCLWFFVWVITVMAISLVGASSHRIHWGNVILDAFLAMLVTAFFTQPLKTLLCFFRKSSKERKEEIHQKERVAKGKETKYKYNVPYAHYLEWKTADFPQFDSDPYDLNDEDKLQYTHSTVKVFRKFSSAKPKAADPAPVAEGQVAVAVELTASAPPLV